MKEAGAFITTSEGMILQLCEGSDHPEFRKLQKIIWDAAPDSGLLGHNKDGTPVWLQTAIMPPATNMYWLC